ncbi:integrase catalytic domain-containing protein [Nephila pilipes]|uniref:Integrase catalytic domain-containing protein n=1 Tax=Nephila pilipes TaxID=299642 RepID=A0A8X6TZG5_NEPPI|nr:integrase catalytic domain-containing protein [Nephila pilipes]
MEKDTISVSFVCAKSRAASFRKTTVPRLELLTCCIGARLSTVVIKALGLENIPVFYWSDSSTALNWIEINGNWRNLNAADLPSRGCSVSALVKSRWWKGLDWLKGIEEKLPKPDAVLNDEEIQMERRKTVASHLTFTKEKLYLKYFSSYFKIVRMTA